MSEESVGDAGSNHLGYYSCCWAPDGSGIAAHGFTGALHIWRRPRSSVGSDATHGGGGSAGHGGWLPAHALGGHYGSVVDACWAADGACLLTVSEDQTARMTTRLAGGHWCEIARPQVHGHDFSSVATLPCPAASGSGGDAHSSGGGGGNGGAANGSGGPAAAPRYVYASGSEEKVVRVFEAPRAFHDTLALARGRAPAGGGATATRSGALGAALPALGLSNKAVYEEDASGSAEAACLGMGALGLGPTGPDFPQGPDLAPHSAPSAVSGPPLEEHLAQNTLWPEVHKLYGHGNELYCLDAGGSLAGGEKSAPPALPPAPVCRPRGAARQHPPPCTPARPLSCRPAWQLPRLCLPRAVCRRCSHLAVGHKQVGRRRAAACAHVDRCG